MDKEQQQEVTMESEVSQKSVVSRNRQVKRTVLGRP